MNTRSRRKATVVALGSRAPSGAPGPYKARRMEHLFHPAVARIFLAPPRPPPTALQVHFLTPITPCRQEVGVNMYLRPCFPPTLHSHSVSGGKWRRKRVMQVFQSNRIRRRNRYYAYFADPRDKSVYILTIHVLFPVITLGLPEGMLAGGLGGEWVGMRGYCNRRGGRHRIRDD